MHKLTARCRQIGRLRMNPTEKADQKKLLRFYLQYWRVWKQFFFNYSGVYRLETRNYFHFKRKKVVEVLKKKKKNGL